MLFYMAPSLGLVSPRPSTENSMPSLILAFQPNHNFLFFYRPFRELLFVITLRVATVQFYFHQKEPLNPTHALLLLNISSQK